MNIAAQAYALVTLITAYGSSGGLGQNAALKQSFKREFIGLHLNSQDAPVRRFTF